MKSSVLFLAFGCLLKATQAQHPPYPEMDRFRFDFESDKDEVPENPEDINPGNYGPCCHPECLQGTLQFYPPGSSSATEVRFYVDAASQNLALLSAKNRMGMRRLFRCNRLTKSCTIYNIDELRKSCSQQKVLNATLDSFWNRCIPQQARRPRLLKVGAKILGQSPMPILQWAFDQGQVKFKKMVTAIGCIPVAEVMTSMYGIYQAKRADIYYFDVETYIKDLRVFQIPLFCRSAEAKESETDDEQQEPLFFLRFK